MLASHRSVHDPFWLKGLHAATGWLPVCCIGTGAVAKWLKLYCMCSTVFILNYNVGRQKRIWSEATYWNMIFNITIQYVSGNDCYIHNHHGIVLTFAGQQFWSILTFVKWHVLLRLNFAKLLFALFALFSMNLELSHNLWSNSTVTTEHLCCLCSTLWIRMLSFRFCCSSSKIDFTTVT